MLSGISFVLNLGLTIVLHEVIGWAEEAAYATSLGVVLVVNFILCRTFVFNAAAGSLRRQALGYLGGTIIFRSLEYVCFLGIHSGFDVDYRLTVIAVSVVAMVVKFFVYRVLFNGKA